VVLSRSFAIATALLLVLGLWGGSRASAGQATVNQSGAGMRLYRDPTTGRIGAPPAGAVLNRAAPAPRAESDRAAALGEALEPGPGGGMRVRLSGRHRAVVRRHADSVGATHECVEGGAATDE
jgi:hypothetical protein